MDDLQVLECFTFIVLVFFFEPLLCNQFLGRILDYTNSEKEALFIMLVSRILLFDLSQCPSC